MRHRSGRGYRPSLHIILLAALLSVLWIAGGASRADATGQIVVRGTAWGVLIVTILFGFGDRSRRSDMPGRFTWHGDAWPVACLIAAALLLVLSQLLPLPPEVWQALPGREPLIEAGRLAGGGQPWRPLAIVPGAAVNAASSMIIPLTVFVVAIGLPRTERAYLPGLLLLFIAASVLIALLQVSGTGFDNPLVNDTPGQIGGLFANRNHFALFTAMGCLIAPVWAFQEGKPPRWRGFVALALILLFVLTILASGSRTGMVLGVLGVALGLVIVREGIRKELRHLPKWTFPALIAGIVGIIVAFVIISVMAGRAVSINRVIAIDPGQDMRSRGLPTVLAMIREYLPLGSGLGGFDPIFRMHEPFALLKFTYFNHAHNDFLEIALDAGIPGVLLLAAALAWWLWASVRAWRAGSGMRHALPKLGSAVLLLVIVASAFDYPARTPIIMAMLVIAGLWLSGRQEEVERGGPSFTPDGPASIGRGAPPILPEAPPPHA